MSAVFLSYHKYNQKDKKKIERALEELGMEKDEVYPKR